MGKGCAAPSACAPFAGVASLSAAALPTARRPGRAGAAPGATPAMPYLLRNEALCAGFKL